MNTLSDLRSTLDDRAEQVHDGEAVVRREAVRHRVSVVRRRRRAAGAGLLSLVLVAVGAAALVARGPSEGLPAAPTVLGVKAPDTVTSLGYTYRTDGHASTVDGTGSVTIAASDRPRLLSWTRTGTTSLRMVLPNGEIWTSRASAFHDFVTLPAGPAGTLRIDAGSGRAAVATYEMTDDRPADAYTRDGITFRRSVAGVPLLGAVATGLGQTHGSFGYTAPRGQTSLHLVCSGLPPGYAVHVLVGGEDRISSDPSSCDADIVYDAGAGSFTSLSVGRPGSPVRVVVRVTHGMRDTREVDAAQVPGLRMGVGVYGPRALGSVAGTSSAAEYVEQDGHLWQRDQSETTVLSDPLAPPTRHRATGFQGPASLVWRTHGATGVTFQARGMPAAGGSFAGGVGGMGNLWVPQGAVVHYGLTKGAGSIGVVFYRRAD
jgi:hypothetical protein